MGGVETKFLRNRNCNGEGNVVGGKQGVSPASRRLSCSGPEVGEVVSGKEFLEDEDLDEFSLLDVATGADGDIAVRFHD